MTPGRRRLILTRHAKSSWDDPALEDHDRPLNPRGHRGARELGDWLASRGYEPEEVLCSTALRTRETWDDIAATPLEVLAKLRIMPELYHADPETMLEALRTAHGDTVMMLGHNPGIAAFALGLASTPPNVQAFNRYPTAATSVFDFQIEDWRDAQPGAAALRDFFVPGDGG